MKKKISYALGVCVLSLGFAGAASGAGSWSGTVTLDVPGFNKSVTANWANYKKAKASDDSEASFKSISRSSISGMDGRVVNSDGVSRSSWARNLKPGVRVDVATTASKSYNYVPQISSDITQVGTDSISFKWSPDKPAN